METKTRETSQQYAERLVQERTKKYDEVKQTAEPLIAQLDSEIASLQRDKSQLGQEVDRKSDNLLKINNLKDNFDVLCKGEGLHIYSIYGPRFFQWADGIHKSISYDSNEKDFPRHSYVTTRDDLLSYYGNHWETTIDFNSQPFPKEDLAYQTLLYLRDFSVYGLINSHLARKEILPDIEKLVRALYTRTMQKDEYLAILQRTHPVVINAIEYGEKNRECSFGSYIAQNEERDKRNSPFPDSFSPKISNENIKGAIKEVNSAYGAETKEQNFLRKLFVR